jgi:hypothetical protein
VSRTSSHSHASSWRRLAGVALPLAVAATVALVPATSSAGRPQSPMHSGKQAVSGGVLMAQAVHQGRIVPGRGSSAARPLLPNVKASNQGNQPVNESPITANPANGNQLLSGGNDYNCSTIQGFYTSGDGGATWPNQHCLTPPLPGKQGFGDPNVAYDHTGAAYILGINATGSLTGGVIVYQKSTNNGATWSATAAGPTTFYSNGLPDKPWTEADNNPASPFAGCLYTSITQFDTSFNRITITVDHSCDGGTTWSGPKAVSAEQIFPNVVQFSDIAIGDDGTVYVTWMDCFANGPAGDCGNTLATIQYSKSTDGGNTWTAPATITTAQLAPDSCFCAFYGNVPTTSERTSEIPVVDVDSGDDLYVGYYHYTGSFMQQKVIKSTNGGSSWGAPVNVNPGSTRDQFLSWLSVDDATGRVGVTYLHRVGGSYKNFVAVSMNGGASFAGNKSIATAASRFVDDGFGGGFMGDYNGNIWAGENLHASWVDTRTGTAQDWTGGVAL